MAAFYSAARYIMKYGMADETGEKISYGVCLMALTGVDDKRNASCKCSEKKYDGAMLKWRRRRRNVSSERKWQTSYIIENINEKNGENVWRNHISKQWRSWAARRGVNPAAMKQQWRCRLFLSMYIQKKAVPRQWL